jgi:hypothetical protein
VRAEFLTVALVCSAACGSEYGAPPAPAELTIVEDSAGITVHFSVAPRWGDQPGWSIEGPPLDLGRTGSGPAHDFFQVTDAIFLSDSRIAVAVGPEIRFYDFEGRSLHELGGRGTGPGEYSGPISLAARNDSLFAYDAALRRLSVYTSSLDEPSVRMLEGGLFSPRIAPGARGILMHASSLTEDRVGHHRAVAPIVRVSPEALVLDTVADLYGFEFIMLSRDGETLIEPSPFARNGHFAGFRDRIVVGDASFFEYRVLSGDGALETVVRGSRPLFVSRERLRREREALLGDDPSPGALRLWTELLEAIPQPMTLPAFQALEVDPNGYVWLEAFTGQADVNEPRRWDVFSDDHEWLGHVLLPPGFQALAFGHDRIVGVAKNGLDVETVQLLSVDKG